MAEDIEVRRITRRDGKTVEYDAVKGTVWASGWDERLVDEVDKLADGVFMLEFQPDSEPGSDGILWVHVYKLILKNK